MALENKLGITDSAQLAREEERISKKKAAELFENEILDTLKADSFDALKTIHKYLFGDIYDFAGKVNRKYRKRQLPICARYVSRCRTCKY